MLLMVVELVLLFWAFICAAACGWRGDAAENEAFCICDCI